MSRVEAELRVQTDCGRFVMVRSSFPFREWEAGDGARAARRRRRHRRSCGAHASQPESGESCLPHVLALVQKCFDQS